MTSFTIPLLFFCFKTLNLFFHYHIYVTDNKNNKIFIKKKWYTDYLKIHNEEQKEFEDTKGVTRIRKSKKDRPNEKGQRDKQRSTKHYT
jgi:hypothetical protein